MKNFKMTFGLLFVLFLALAVSCAGGADAAGNETVNLSGGAAVSGNSTSSQGSSGVEVKTLSEAEGKEWVLIELRSAGTTVRIDRAKLEADSMGDFFTILFQEGRVSGVGAPNRFFGPYTVGSGDALTISENLASTMMFAFREPDELKEHEYFAYVTKVTRWAVRDGKLELYSMSDGRETVLVFELK